MRHWPPVLAALLLAACAMPNPGPAPVPPLPARELDAPSASPTASPTPAPTATPTPSPAPSATASPTQLETVGEAEHGPDPFPSPPAGGMYNLASATVIAGANNESARGAVDGGVYTEWNARQGVAANVWYAIDLGAKRRLSRVDLLPDASPEGAVFYNVEVSDDYETWKTVGSGKGTGSNAEPTWATAMFPTESARYVRIVPTNWGKSWVGVWELRLSP